MAASVTRGAACAWTLPLLLIMALTLAWPKESLAAEHALTLQGQGNRSACDYSFEDGAVRVIGAVSGDVYYDPASRVLKLVNVCMDGITLYAGCDSLTIQLFGNNVGSKCFVACDASNNSDADVTITGTGSAEGTISGMNDLTVVSGTIVSTEHGISCDGNLTVRGGEVTATSHSYRPGIFCNGNLKVSGGAVSASAQGYAEGARCGGMLTMEGGTLTAKGSVGARCGGMLTMEGGTLTAKGSGSRDDLRCEGDLISSGGTLIGCGNTFEIFCGGRITMCGGTVEAANGIRCTSLSLSKGSIHATTGNIRCEKDCDVTGDVDVEGLYCMGNVFVKGGMVTYPISCDGNVFVEGGMVTYPIYCGGNLFVKGGEVAARIWCMGNITVSGGSISLKKYESRNHDPGISCWGGDVVLKKGSILIDDSQSSKRQSASISIYGGDLVMTGGTLRVTGSVKEAIYVERRKIANRDKTIPAVKRGGKIKITGGTLTAQVRNPSKTAVIVADSMSNKAESLKNIKGRISADGAMFSIGGNTYRTIKKKGEDKGVSLVKYNAKATKAKLSKVKFAGWTYAIRVVGTKAFATRNGAKVTSCAFKSSLDSIDANAFNGAKSLKKIHLGNQPQVRLAKNAFSGTRALEKLEFGSYNKAPFAPAIVKHGKVLKSLKWAEDVKVSKTAFAACGKAGGRGLMVTFEDDDVPTRFAKGYRSLFIKHGMPKAFQLQIS